MKVSAFMVILLLMPLLHTQSHGIRMRRQLTFVEEEEEEAQHMYQVEAPNSNSHDDAEAGVDDVHGGVYYSYENTQWEEKKRKLLITATPSSSSSSEGHTKTEFSATSSTSEFESYHDIAGMDYSPAKRKPPIHN